MFGDLLDDAVLEGDGGYVFDDGAWWAPSGRAVLDAGAFFLPVGTVDERGSQAVTEYDDYHLLPVRTTDPAGNSFSAINHYRSSPRGRSSIPTAIGDPSALTGSAG